MIPIAKVQLGQEEIASVNEVLKSGNLREGRLCRAFEEAFAEKVSARYAVAMGSGTLALHAAYMQLIEPDDEVLVPSFTFFATASMVCWAGGKPVFCDIDDRTFCIDVEDVKRKITPRTKAIAPVHLFGNVCEIDEIMQVADEHNLHVIWDAAQAHLSEYKGKDVGSFSDAVCYSFYATKNMTTGEGGMITTEDAELAERFRLLKNQGQSEKYRHTMLGTNYRMTDMAAAIGLVQLKRLDEYTGRRIENAEMLSAALKDIPQLTPPLVCDYAKHTFHQYTILVDATSDTPGRDELAATLKEHGVGTAINYPLPLHRQPVFKEVVGDITLPKSEYVAKHCLSLPVCPAVTKEQIQEIIELLKEIYL